MLEVFVEGVYESDVGSGQKKFYDFKYNFKTARLDKKGLETHVLRRFIPLLIKKDKKFAQKLFSKIRSLVITDIKELDGNCYLEGKDINELNEWEIQDLACLYDLYEVPLAGQFSITELRERAILAYMKKVLNIPMKTAEEKAQLDFLEKQPDGTYKLNLGEEKIIVQIYDSYFGKKKDCVKKKSLSDFIKTSGVAIANGILGITGNQTIENSQKEENGSDENSQSGNGMPSVSQLLKPNPPNQ